MRRLLALLAIALLAACLPASAQGAFGINSFDVSFLDAEGEPAEAGSHPFSMTVSSGTNLDGALVPEAWLRDLSVAQIPGLVGDTTAYQRCTTAQYLNSEGGGEPACPLPTQVGIAAATAQTPGKWETHPIFSVVPPPGVLVRLGFRILTENIFVDVTLNDEPPYNAIGASRNTPQLVNVFGSKIQLWGDPSDPRHDGLRGDCGHQAATLPPGDIAGFEFEGSGSTSCGVDPNPRPFLTMPTDCSAPLPSSFEASSWKGDTDSGSILTHDAKGNAEALRGCAKLTFKPSISAAPTARAASSPTGLDFSLDVQDEGLTSVGEGPPSAGALAQSTVERAVVTLPVGMTANPSVAEGLEVCSESELDAERLDSVPGEGCPQGSKIGTLEVQSPLVEEPIGGALYQATPHANRAGDALIAFYIVFKNPALGIIVKQPVRVEPDPRTGQLKAITDDIPQLPFSHFRLHFREGGRSPLVSPPLCGSYEPVAELYPRSGGAPYTAGSTFRILSGPDEAPCPPAGAPFEPGFQAGADSNAAGAHSPFMMELTRRDGDQDLTRFDATLPSGVGAILRGVDRCPEAQIALAKAKTGRAELTSPSCPLNSLIGTAQAGAGVGSQLTYVPGRIYLAGPFAGAPISVVAIVPAVAGPFDVGTVVTRQALEVNPRSGVVSADGAHSDPIPHILAGIPLVVRDIQVHIDRPSFTYNPTSCDLFATTAQIWGGGPDPFSVADDSPVGRSARFQAASCQSLGFKPSLSLKLKGATKRGGFPALRLLYRPRPGDANLSQLVLRFPRSEFIEQGHFRTICTRVQFAAGAGHGSQCPKGSVYGHARVFTPILPEPLEGPVFLRSSDHNLPDAVLALKGPASLPIDFEVQTRIDSVHGGLRAIASGLPDAPVTKAIVDMQGGQKGLFVNSRDICADKNRARVSLTAQSAKQATLKPVLRAQCGKGRRGDKRGSQRRAG